MSANPMDQRGTIINHSVASYSATRDRLMGDESLGNGEYTVRDRAARRARQERDSDAVDWHRQQKTLGRPQNHQRFIEANLRMGGRGAEVQTDDPEEIIVDWDGSSPSVRGIHDANQANYAMTGAAVTKYFDFEVVNDNPRAPRKSQRGPQREAEDEYARGYIAGTIAPVNLPPGPVHEVMADVIVNERELAKAEYAAKRKAEKAKARAMRHKTH